MRILQVHTRYRQPGGEDVAVSTEARLLRDAGHELHAVTVANPDGGIRAGLRLAAAPWNPSAAHRVRQTAERVRPDVAHVHNTWFSLSPAVLSELHDLGVPVVMTLHNYRLICSAATLFRDGAPCRECVGTSSWPAVRHGCYRGSRIASAVAATTIAAQGVRGTWHRDVDRFLALTEFGRQQFIDGGLPAEQITVKSNSVTDPGPRSRPPSASNTVVFIGRLSEEKGAAVLLEAWRSAPASLQLVVVGQGPLETALHAVAPPRVEFRSRCEPEEIAELLLGARALIFPSIWYEGQGLVALEAAASGLPVLSSDLGVMSELFAPNAEDLLMPPGDIAGIAAALQRLADADFVDAFGALTRRRFEERYTHEIARYRLEDVYGSLQDAGPMPGDP